MASLVSYPALLAVGIPPVSANVTNTAALIFTAVGSGVSSRKELKGHAKEIWKLLPLTAAGGFCGSLLLLSAPASSFEHVVPFFILFAAMLILRPNLLKFPRPDVADGRSVFRRRLFGTLFFALVFAVGIYAGYFGAAAGVVMLAMLSATSPLEFAEYNAVKNIALGASNLVATLLFLFLGRINWMAALPLAVGFFIGGSIGPRIVRHVPVKALRRVIAALAFVLAVSLFVQTYFFQA